MTPASYVGNAVQQAKDNLDLTSWTTTTLFWAILAPISF
jgi:hypothetical protein